MQDGDEVYPVTIVQARYGGTYEPGPWLAFACHPNQLPDLWDASDVLASRFYSDHSDEIGGGMTPSDAYADLVRLNRERHQKGT